MSGNKAKTVTTRYRQKDLNGDILYEGTPALPTCISKSFICSVFTHINHDFWKAYCIYKITTRL